MNTQTLLDEGKVSEALAEVKQEVKAHPTDVQLRTLLFELLSMVGDWAGGERQLDVIAHQETEAALAISVYLQVLKVEEKRQQVFHGEAEPEFLFQKPSYADCHLGALKSLCSGKIGEATGLLNQSEKQRITHSGQVDQQAFSEFLDADDRISPFLEVFIHDSYVWLPFEQIKHISISAPKYLRDLMWLQADLEGFDNPIGPVFIPVLYANSASSYSDQVRLGRITQWQSLGEELALGLGQRLFLIDGQDRGMLEFHEVEFDHDVLPEGNA